jgi:putative flippase GtrA
MGQHSINETPIVAKLFELIKKIWRIRFFRFLVVGGVNTLFSYSVFAIFILLKIPYGIALLIATICGILFNFKTTGRIVFGNKSNSLIFKFFLVYGITYCINYAGLWGFVQIHIKPLVAGAFLILPSAIIAYFLNKTLVFSKSLKTS